MTRATPDQFKLFQANARAAAGGATPAAKKLRRAPVLRESQVDDQIVGFLESRGWRCIRLLAGTFKSMDGRRFVVGAPTGIPDRLCIRGAEFFLLELKAKDGKLRPKQDIWIRQARQESIPIHVVNDYDMFVRAYREQHSNEFVKAL